MAEKLTDQTELAEAPATGDLIHIVDVSDTTDDAAGSSKKITIANLMGSNVSTTMVREPIQTVSNATAGEISFTNIPQTYDRLIIKGRMRPGGGSGSRYAKMYLNSDTTDTNYNSTVAGALNGAAWSFELNYPMIADLDITPSSYWCEVEYEVPNYTDTSRTKWINGVFRGGRSSLYGTQGLVGVQSAVTAAVTQIDIDEANNIICDLTLYGEREATIGGVTYPGDRGTLTTVKTPVATVTNTTAGAFDITGIPAGGERLVIQGYLRSDATTTNDISHIYLNGNETLTNYYTRQFYNASTNGAVTNEPRCAASISGASSVTDAYTRFTTVIEDYDSSYPKMISTEFFAPNAATDVRAGHAYVISTISDPVTQITVKADGDPTDQLFGEVTVYVEKDVVFSPGKHEIETIENTTAGQFDFQNIPPGFKRLWLEGYVESDSSAETYRASYLYFNNDTTLANYYFTYHYGMDTTSPGFEIAQPRVTVASATSVGASPLEIKIEGYDSDRVKSARIMSDVYRVGGAQILQSDGTFFHDSMTAAINRLTLVEENDPTNGLIGKLTLYGEM